MYGTNRCESIVLGGRRCSEMSADGDVHCKWHRIGHRIFDSVSHFRFLAVMLAAVPGASMIASGAGVLWNGLINGQPWLLLLSACFGDIGVALLLFASMAHSIVPALFARMFARCVLIAAGLSFVAGILTAFVGSFGQVVEEQLPRMAGIPRGAQAAIFCVGGFYFIVVYFNDLQSVLAT
jgi:hypothetical protein